MNRLSRRTFVLGGVAAAGAVVAPRQSGLVRRIQLMRAPGYG